jgi:hypothetical protein
VRLRSATIIVSLALSLCVPHGLCAQNPDTLTPDQSTAKAKQIMNQLVEAMGGQKFLAAKGSECNGRVAQFGHNGEMSGYIDFHEYWQFPDKKRTDLGKKGNIIDLFFGDEGWTLDRGGVSEEAATVVSDFQGALKRNLSTLLRQRMHEQGTSYRFAGMAVVDLKPVDWVEITDADEQMMRVAVDRSTHLPVRSVAVIDDRENSVKIEEVTVYTNFQSVDGVNMPKQISRERDGRRTAQVFYDSCQLNPSLAPDFFTKAALDKRFSELGGKKK